MPLRKFKVFREESARAPDAARPDGRSQLDPLPSEREFKQSLLAHKDYLLRVALKLCKDRSEAEDLIQDTVLRALEHRDQMREALRMRAWLLTILRNSFHDLCRRKQRGPRLLTDSGALPDLPAEPPAAPRPWEQITPQEISGALRQLSPEYREVFESRARGMSYDQIASALAVPKNTVASRLNRAIEKLCRYLRPESEE